jgi:cell division protein FtsI/penicillin-binding protein 2
VESHAEAGDAPEAEESPSTAEPDDEPAEFDGKIPNIAQLAPYPDAEDLLAHAKVDKEGRYWSERQGKAVPLTLDAHLQASVESLLRNYSPPYAAVAAIDPSTGKVLALAQYSKDAPSVKALSLRAVYPAASVFKLVTAAALLEQGVDPEQQVCFHGGKHRLQAKLLQDSPGDSRCYDMTDAMAKSANVVFAKLASKHLTPELLRTEAGRFGFNRELSFDQPMEKSAANIPDEAFPFANTAAGFGQVFLSPLHGALLAASVADHGDMPTPYLIDEQKPTTPVRKKVMDSKVADEIGEMMARTISGGTAKRAFHDRGRPAMQGIEVAGKTGSLNEHNPFHDYTWFVGFAPKEQPTIALAVVVVNGPLWRVRAPYVARETFRSFLFPEPTRSKKAQARR